MCIDLSCLLDELSDCSIAEDVASLLRTYRVKGRRNCSMHGPLCHYFELADDVAGAIVNDEDVLAWKAGSALDDSRSFDLPPAAIRFGHRFRAGEFADLAEPERSGLYERIKREMPVAMSELSPF